MKKNLHAMLVLVLVLGIAVTMGGCPLAGDGEDDPAFVAMSDGGTTTICVQNIGGGVTGGTDHGFCEENPEEQDEWHFVINDLDPLTAAPESITAEFDTAGTVVIPVEKVTPGGVAHYTLKGLYLDDTLLSACAEIDSTATYNRFNLSHAPCGEAPPVGYNLTISSTDGGSVVTPGEGTFTYDAGTVANLVATPAAGYQFVSWTGDVGTIANVNSASTTITMNGDYSITANFAIIDTPVCASVSPTTRQYDLANPANATTTITWNDATSIMSIADNGSTLTLNTHYTVVGSTLTILNAYLAGKLTAAGQSVTLTINFGICTAPFTVTAIDTSVVCASISPITNVYDLTNPGDVTTLITWHDSPHAIASIYDGMAYLTPVTHYTVGDHDGTATLTIRNTYLAGKLTTAGQSVELTVTFDTDCEATFTITASDTSQPVCATISPTARQYDLASPANATTTITWNDATGIVSIHDGTGYLTSGTHYTLVGSTLTILHTTYLAGKLTAAGHSVTLTINFDVCTPVTFTITAILEEIPVQYDLVTASTAGGEVTTPGEGTFTYDAGTVVNLVATPAANYRFVDWSGGVVTMGNVEAASTTITMNGDYSITADFAKIQYELTVGSTAGGSVSTPGEGTFTYDAGTVVNLVATPDTGYRFRHWSGDVGGTSPSTTITMDSDKSVAASFIRQYALTVAADPSGSGTTGPGVGSHTYDAGAVVNLSAAPNAGYRFDQWSGDVSGTSASTSITMDSDKSVTANFIRQYTLTMAVSPSGSGTTGPGVGSHSYDAGTVVNLSAAANAGYRFDQWSGDVSGTSPSSSITMDSDKSVTANFIRQYALTVAVGPSGSGMTGPGVGSHSYDAGTVVNLSAAANAGYRFDQWSGDASGTSPSTSITMGSDKSVTANFIRQYTLTVAVGPSGSGTTGPGVGSHSYDAGTVVNLSAAANAGYRFNHWSGDVSGTSASTSVTMDGDKSVTANFIRRYTLTVAVSPSGSGTTGPGVGSHSYDAGTVVNLSAAANAGYRFDQWSGDASGTSASTSITMDSDKSVTANFIRRYTLTVAVSPSGSGTTGPAVGSHSYDAGTVVNLSAAANAGYRFDQWSGDASGASPSTSITMDSDKSVTANFTAVYELTVSSTPGGWITAPGYGTFTYGQGTAANIVAEPAEGYRFVKWVGDVYAIALVNSASTTITIQGNYKISARFERGVGGPAVRITGVTKGVDGVVLPGADVVLYQNGEAVANAISDETGYYYALAASGPGAYDVMVGKEGFSNEARPISVSELTTCVLDFVGDYGLIPRAPSTPYVLACMSLWKFGESPLQLSTSKMLQVISAWLYG